MKKVLLLAGIFGCLSIFLGRSLGMVKERLQQKPSHVIIDTDVGADDAMAIMMLLSKKSKASVFAITCLEGNTGVINATKNALLLLNVTDRTDIPVYKGSASGLASKGETDQFFGYDGFGDAFIKPQLRIGKGHAAIALANFVKHNPGVVSVLCLGPLTNIALAIHLNAKFLDEVKELIVVGGSYEGGGNVKPGVEFNMHFDPSAASFVLSNVPKGRPITLIPLETAENASLPLAWREKVLGGVNSDAVRFLNRAERTGLDHSSDSWIPQDPLGAAVLLEPRLVEGWQGAEARVEPCGGLGRGAMFLDPTSSNPNVKLVTFVKGKFLPGLLSFYLSD